MGFSLSVTLVVMKQLWDEHTSCQEKKGAWRRWALHPKLPHANRIGTEIENKAESNRKKRKGCLQTKIDTETEKQN